MSRFVLNSASEPARERSRRFAPRPVAGILLVIAALLLIVSGTAVRSDVLASGGTLEGPETVLAAAGKDGKEDARKGKGKDSDPGKRLEASGKAILRDIRSSSVEDVCGGLDVTVVDGIPLCTHGDDPAPEGFDPKRSVEPVRGKLIAPRAACLDDGKSGYRFEVLYVYATDGASGNRYNTYRDSIQTWVAEMNDIFENSAQLTGGHRQVRLVTDASCRPVVTPVGVSSAALKTFGGSVDALRAKGYNRYDRNYLLFVDDKVYCGIGTIRNDDRKIQDNYNNTGSAYARVDSGCWGGSTAAHEVMHNLGGVQKSAPNDTGSWHCTDERDLMCYKDGSSSPSMRNVCTTGVWAKLDLFDCNHDDYFSTNPTPGSYLSGHWNTADSRFLTNATKPVAVSPASGTVGANVIVSLNGLPAGQDITIAFYGRAIGAGKTDGNGSGKVTVTIPAATTGTHVIRASVGNRNENIDFRVTPSITSAGKVKKNGSAKVKLAGFGANERVALKTGNRTLKTVTVDPSGSASTTVKIAGAKKKQKKATITAVGSSKHSAATALKLNAKSGKNKKGNKAKSAQIIEAAGAEDSAPGREGGKPDGRRGDRA